MTIDSHQHFWKYDPVRDAWINNDMQVIQRDFFPRDLKPSIDELGIDGCVAVQADQSEHETEFLLSLAKDHDFIKGVVGWTDLRAANLPERLEHYSQFKKLKGFRHIVQAEARGFLEQKQFIDGVKSLYKHAFTYDLLVYHFQLEEALQFLKNVIEQKIVIDHMAKPNIKEREIENWRKIISKIASFENVYCKISGMVTEADWKNWRPEDFSVYLDVIFESFGVKRIMYGSDWPVCLVAATYPEQYAIVNSYVSRLSNDEKILVMGENAIRFYNL